ncbi:MAG: Ni/Fe-hydrogenase, b-type cytochrome subunit [Burkholderiales bacterium]|nr:Ni/Fe-hydrogenase, b-type cytochrome subunit [Burkholderiales bacterium]
MRVNPVSGQVLAGPLEPVYVYEAPVRLWHWVMVVAMLFLMGTGYMIGRPPPSIGGEATFHYFFGYIRMIHFIAAMVFAVAFAVRVYWAFVGNHSSRAIFLPPVWNLSWWRGLFSQLGYYLFLKKESERWVGHNPLAQLAMFAMYTLGSLFIIITGLALYAEAWGWGTWPMNIMGWVFVVFGDPQMVRTLHRLTMWYLLLFAVIHVYMVFREDIMSGQSVVGTMISGIRTWKGAPRA